MLNVVIDGGLDWQRGHCDAVNVDSATGREGKYSYHYFVANFSMLVVLQAVDKIANG